MKYTIAIADDETIPLKINAMYVQEFAKKYRLEMEVHCFQSPERLIDFTKDNPVDAVFLDIEMKQVNGIELASKLQKDIPTLVIVFITSHKEFAFEAFEVDAVGYLAKPVEEKQMERIFKKVILQIQQNGHRSLNKALIITEDNVKKKIKQNQVIYIERIGTKSIIVGRAEKHEVYESIRSLMERLEPIFIRVNQGIVVNLQCILKIEKSDVYLKNGMMFTIGRTYLKEVKKAFLEFPEA